MRASTVCFSCKPFLFEYIDNPYWNGLQLKQLEYIRRKLRIPIGLAHPDLSLLCRDKSEDQVLDFLEKQAIFIELSGKYPYQYRGFPDFFQKLRDRHIYISVGSDTHLALEDIRQIDDPLSFVESFNLQDHLISTLFETRKIKELNR